MTALRAVWQCHADMPVLDCNLCALEPGGELRQLFHLRGYPGKSQREKKLEKYDFTEEQQKCNQYKEFFCPDLIIHWLALFLFLGKAHVTLVPFFDI